MAKRRKAVNLGSFVSKAGVGSKSGQLSPQGDSGRLERLSYLSWSKLSLWERDKRLFKQVYIDGIKEESWAMDQGSRMAHAMETGESSGDPIIEQGKMFLPKLKKAEFKVEVDCLVCPLVGKLDTFDPRTKSFRDHKTGKWPWTQKKVNEHGQITFYCYLIWLKYKKLPPMMWLDWLNTDPESKDYGRVKSFATGRSMSDLIKMHSRIKSAWAGISQLAKENGKWTEK